MPVLDPPALSVGIVLVPDFTMLALSAFLDTLRLAADEGDRSRPVRCRWHLMSIDGHPVTSSCGVAVVPHGRLGGGADYDYLVVVGGTLHREHELGDLYRWLRDRAAAGTKLVGVCNGALHLARAGLMAGRRLCASWLHREEIAAEFPDIDVVADELFVWDVDRVTCAGGTSVIHLASALVDRHLGAGTSRKGLRIMLEERSRDGSAPQPASDLAIDPDTIRDARVQRAVLFVEERMADPISISALAARLNLSTRHLERLCIAETGQPLARLIRNIRLAHARKLITEHRDGLAVIAAKCGFADAAHLSRLFKSCFGIPPSSLRVRSQDQRPLSPARR